MGYDITVRFKNKKEKDCMKSFLNENQSILNQLSELPTFYPAVHDTVVYEGEELAYSPKFKNMLGFHGSGIPQYLWYVCAWMAVKSTYRDKDGSLYLCYDDEKINISFDTNNTQNVVVDKDGIRIISKKENENFWRKVIKYINNLDEAQEKQKELLILLNDKWNIYSFDSNMVKPEKLKATKVKIN